MRGGKGDDSAGIAPDQGPVPGGRTAQADRSETRLTGAQITGGNVLQGETRDRIKKSCRSF